MSAIKQGAREGDVLRYRPDGWDQPGRDHTWCREGVAIVRDDGAAFDTYWQSGGDAHRLTETELATTEHLFNLGDYEEIGRHEPSARRQWEEYREDQRQMVTSQHRLQARYFVLRGARPDLETKIANASSALQEAHEKAASAVRNVEWKARELARLETQR